MKLLLKAALLILVLSAPLAFAASLTVGTPTSGNCYPFMCNDSGVTQGVSLTYQEVYNSSAFPGALTINSLGFDYFPGLGPSVAIGGTYDFYLGYSKVGMGLEAPTNENSNYVGGSSTFFGQMSVPAGGSNFGNTLVFSGAPFNYDPTQGDLLMTVIASNQDDVRNTGANGYNWADQSNDPLILRAFTYGGEGWDATSQALVTTFNATAVTPEPGSLLLLGTGLAGLAGAIRRKLAHR